MRKQVLGSRGLELVDFDDVDAAMAAADVIIKQFQAKYPQKVVARPNQLYDDHPVILPMDWALLIHAVYECIKLQMVYVHLIKFIFVCLALTSRSSHGVLHNGNHLQGLRQGGVHMVRWRTLDVSVRKLGLSDS